MIFSEIQQFSSYFKLIIPFSAPPFYETKISQSSCCKWRSRGLQSLAKFVHHLIVKEQWTWDSNLCATQSRYTTRFSFLRQVTISLSLSFLVCNIITVMMGLDLRVLSGLSEIKHGNHFTIQPSTQ